MNKKMTIIVVSILVVLGLIGGGVAFLTTHSDAGKNVAVPSASAKPSKSASSGKLSGSEYRKVYEKDVSVAPMTSGQKSLTVGKVSQTCGVSDGDTFTGFTITYSQPGKKDTDATGISCNYDPSDDTLKQLGVPTDGN